MSSAFAQSAANPPSKANDKVIEMFRSTKGATASQAPIEFDEKLNISQSLLDDVEQRARNELASRKVGGDNNDPNTYVFFVRAFASDSTVQQIKWVNYLTQSSDYRSAMVRSFALVGPTPVSILAAKPGLIEYDAYLTAGASDGRFSFSFSPMTAEFYKELTLEGRTFQQSHAKELSEEFQAEHRVRLVESQLAYRGSTGPFGKGGALSIDKPFNGGGALSVGKPFKQGGGLSINTVYVPEKLRIGRVQSIAEVVIPVCWGSPQDCRGLEPDKAKTTAGGEAAGGGYPFYITARFICMNRQTGAVSGGTVRMVFHAKTRQLAEHGRMRTQCAVFPMSRSPHSHQGDHDRGGGRLGSRAKQEERQGRLAVHHRRREGQTEEALPFIMSDSGH
jgi:hypothetical protein